MPCFALGAPTVLNDMKQILLVIAGVNAFLLYLLPLLWVSDIADAIYRSGHPYLAALTGINAFLAWIGLPTYALTRYWLSAYPRTNKAVGVNPEPTRPLPPNPPKATLNSPICPGCGVVSYDGFHNCSPDGPNVMVLGHPWKVVKDQLPHDLVVRVETWMAKPTIDPPPPIKELQDAYKRAGIEVFPR